MSLTPRSTNPLEIFYSYAHEDEELRLMLDKHLSVLKWEGRIKAWHDYNISAGSVSSEEIYKHLNKADIILLLISPDFISSNYLYSVQMKFALQRHSSGAALVIPVIVRPTDWQNTPLGGLRVLPMNQRPVTLWSNLDEAFFDIYQGIRDVIIGPDNPPLPASMFPVRKISDTAPLSMGNALQKESITINIPQRTGCLRRPIIIILLCLFITLLAGLSAYAYNMFIKIPSDQSAVLTAFCDALKSQQYPTAYTLLSSKDQRLITETQFANELGANNSAFKIIGCETKSSPADNSSGSITLVFANGGTVTDAYTMVQENGSWKIDLKIPGHTAANEQHLCPTQNERCRLKIADSALINQPKPARIESGQPL